MLLHVFAVTVGVALAQADLPNANLPGNSATLPNSNLPGPLPTDNPIILPNTDTSRQAQEERAGDAEWRERIRRTDEWQLQMQQLTAKAVEESVRARAEAEAARKALEESIEQGRP